MFCIAVSKTHVRSIVRLVKCGDGVGISILFVQPVVSVTVCSRRERDAPIANLHVKITEY